MANHNNDKATVERLDRIQATLDKMQFVLSSEDFDVALSALLSMLIFLIDQTTGETPALVAAFRDDADALLSIFIGGPVKVLAQPRHVPKDKM